MIRKYIGFEGSYIKLAALFPIVVLHRNFTGASERLLGMTITFLLELLCNLTCFDAILVFIIDN